MVLYLFQSLLFSFSLNYLITDSLPDGFGNFLKKKSRSQSDVNINIFGRLNLVYILTYKMAFRNPYNAKISCINIQLIQYLLAE